MKVDEFSTGQEVLRGLKRAMSEICETSDDCWESDCKDTRDEKSPICAVYVNNRAVRRSDVCLDRITHCWSLGSYGHFAFLGRNTHDDYILGYVVSSYFEHYARIVNVPKVEWGSLTGNPLEDFDWNDAGNRWARSEKEAEDALTAMISFAESIRWPAESEETMLSLMAEFTRFGADSQLKIT